MTHFCEGLTTEISIEILLKKVRHRKCDPLLGGGSWGVRNGRGGRVMGLAGWGSVGVRCVMGFSSFRDLQSQQEQQLHESLANRLTYGCKPVKR